MTNLIVSRRCNQHCSYCFALDQPGADPSEDYISLDDFDQRLDYLDRSEITQARFLGGEPTLHPQFPELVRRARARGKTIVVFSNGLIPEAALNALEDLSPAECGVVMNCTGPANLRKLTALSRLGTRAQPGCNIYHLGQDLNRYIPLVNESGCKRALRIGLAQPVLGGKNAYLPAKYYNQVGDQVAHFALHAAAEGIKVEFDCGFVRCMFSPDALNQLVEIGADIGWHCSPVIDVDIDGRAFHCFPLAKKYWLELEPQTTAGDLRESFFAQTAVYRQFGIFRECLDCSSFHEKSCSGGCLANIMRYFTIKSFQIVL